MDHRLKVVGIAAGAKDSCALLSDGTVKCWGDVSAGELGLPLAPDVGNVGDNELPGSVGTVPL